MSGLRAVPRRRHPQTLIAPLFAVAAVLLGGASAAGWLANLILYLLAIGVLIHALWSQPARSLAPAERWLLAIGGVFLLWGVVQLVPLPSALWRTLPGRAPVAGAFELLHVPLPALPLSLDPERTRAALLPLVLALAAMVSVR